jgi:desulfoferrodoxin (superoxide reductase-like protein)
MQMQLRILLATALAAVSNGQDTPNAFCGRLGAVCQNVSLGHFSAFDGTVSVRACTATHRAVTTDQQNCLTSQLATVIQRQSSPVRNTTLEQDCAEVTVNACGIDAATVYCRTFMETTCGVWSDNTFAECQQEFNQLPVGEPGAIVGNSQTCRLSQLSMESVDCQAANGETVCVNPPTGAPLIPTDLAAVIAATTLNVYDENGARVVEGRYEVGAEPRMGDPYLTLDSQAMATVVIRGADGSIDTMTGFTPPRLWITDQTGEVLCTEDSFGFGNGCAVPPSATSVQAHQYNPVQNFQNFPMGLVSGPVLNTLWETNAAVQEERTSAFGINSAAFTEVPVDSPPLEHEPYITLDHSTLTGRLIVLGDNGSTTSLHAHVPVHYIAAVWARDQHGRVVTFTDLSTSVTGPSVAVDVSAVVPAVTSLVPYSYGNRHGLWKGRDALGFHAVIAVNPSPPGLGSIPRKDEPYAKIDEQMVAHIVVRGNGGSTTALSALTVQDHPSNVFVVASTGLVICHKRYDGTEPGFPSFSCPLAPMFADNVTVQVYQLNTARGLFAGPVLHPAWEQQASRWEAITADGASQVAGYSGASRKATSVPALDDPFITYDVDTGVGNVAVLGVAGSTTALSTHDVEAIWGRDQHGTIVFYHDRVDGTTGQLTGDPRVEFSLAEVEPVVTSLIPFQYCRNTGLVQGLNALGFAAVRDNAELGAVDASGNAVPNGRYQPGATPRKQEPHVSISSSHVVTVTIRGAGGSTASWAATSSFDRVANIWVTDADGNVLCENLYGGTEATPVLTCDIAPSAGHIQAHQFGVEHGLWSGPLLNVEWEVFASVKVANATNTSRLNGASVAPIENQPSIVFNNDRYTGYGLVHGPSGSSRNLCDVALVDAVWARDQHGTIVWFDTMADDAFNSIFQLDLRTANPNVTSLVPYHWSDSAGLYTGNDAIAQTDPIGVGVGEEGGEEGDEEGGVSGAAAASDCDDDMGSGAIAAIVLWVLLVVTLVVAGVFYHKRQQNTPPSARSTNKASAKEDTKPFGLDPTTTRKAANPVYGNDLAVTSPTKSEPMLTLAAPGVNVPDETYIEVDTDDSIDINTEGVYDSPSAGNALSM